MWKKKTQKKRTKPTNKGGDPKMGIPWEKELDPGRYEKVWVVKTLHKWKEKGNHRSRFRDTNHVKSTVKAERGGEDQTDVIKINPSPQPFSDILGWDTSQPTRHNCFTGTTNHEGQKRKKTSTRLASKSSNWSNCVGECQNRAGGDGRCNQRTPRSSNRKRRKVEAQ